MNRRYITRKAAPPSCPTWNGNRQMFPRPTALPTAAKMNPIRVAHVSRGISTELMDGEPTHCVKTSRDCRQE